MNTPSEKFPFVKFSFATFASSLAFISCQSSPFPGFLALKSNTQLPTLFDAWHSQCIGKRSDGSFLSTLRTNQIPELLFEGRWTAQFMRFQGRVASPLNQSLVTIELTPQNQTISISPDMRHMQSEAADSIQKAAHSLAILGPQGLRKMICGITGFSEPGAKAFSSAADTPHKQFGFINRLLFEGHRIDVTARYDVHAEQTVAKIHLKAPLLVQTPELTIDWQGKTQPLQPTQLEFTGKDVAVTLFIEDFE